jgi:hypothetical protein
LALKIADVGLTVLSARGVRIKAKAVDLRASMDLPSKLLGSTGTLDLMVSPTFILINCGI